MGHKTLIDGVGYDITGGRCLVDGVGYSIQKGRTLVGGVGYDVAFAPPSIPVSDLAVGESVYANVGGVRTEFLIVHKGKPDSSYYDASCDGIWLLMKNVYTTITNTITGNYSESTLHSYLNGTFLDLLDADVANAIKTVKIPYNTGIYTSIQTGSNGLSTKAFALSLYEVGFTSSMNTDFVDRAACLSYFTGTAYTDSRRIGYLNGVATDYALRTTYRASTSYLWGVSKTGIYATLAKNKSHGVRPAFILDIDTPVHAETFDIIG